MANVSMYSVTDENEWIIIDDSLEGEPSDMNVNYVDPRSRKIDYDGSGGGVPGRSRFSDRNLRISTGRKQGIFSLYLVQTFLYLIIHSYTYMFLTNMLRMILLCSNNFQYIVHYIPLWKIDHYHPKLLLGKVFSMCVCVCMCPCVDELTKGIKCIFALWTISSCTFFPLLLGQEHNAVFTGKTLPLMKKNLNIIENVVFPVTSALVHTISFHPSLPKFHWFLISKWLYLFLLFLMSSLNNTFCVRRLVSSVV